jgi:3-methyladenine DNA glycosylase AlkD
MTLEEIKKDIKALADPVRARHSQRFFKTGKGQYGYGDIFLGLAVPQSRIVAKKYKDIDLSTIGKLLHSKIHEERTIALAILCDQFKRDFIPQDRIYKFYLSNTKWINNWDLVDISASRIVGTYLLDRDRKILYKLAKSKDLWEKRIAIISTLAFIANNDFTDTLAISELLLKDKHDLIHKAVGWMLREVGKRDIKALTEFLDKNVSQMPRTTLRYAIERFPEPERLAYLRA